MNLFIVPSWYPSASNPSYGIFVKEQIEMLARERPKWKIGVSKWGQGDSEKLIWVKDHVKNLRKLNKHGLDKASVLENSGFKEYYQPALSWTKRFRKGNLREIIRCNELNYQAHTLESGKPEVIMVHACYPGILIASYLSDKYNIPTHLHVRLGGFMFERMLTDLGSMKKDLLAAISEADLISVTSDFQGSGLQQWIPKSKTLYNPVDTNFFQIGGKSENYALVIGRLEDEKGFDILLDAVSNIPDLSIKIAGSGSERNDIERKINVLGLTNRVSLVGEVDRLEVKNLIQKSQFLILPSKYETFGNVLLEAMACGKPVVATKCGGPEEIVPQEAGCLAEIDSKDLSEKIQYMINELDTFNSDSIRKVAIDRFSPQKWASDLEMMLIGILSK